MDDDLVLCFLRRKAEEDWNLRNAVFSWRKRPTGHKKQPEPQAPTTKISKPHQFKSAAQLTSLTCRHQSVSQVRTTPKEKPGFEGDVAKQPSQQL